MSADGGCIYEVLFVFEETGDIAEELPGESIYLREGIFEISRLLPDARGPQYNFVHLSQERIRKWVVKLGCAFKPVCRREPQLNNCDAIVSVRSRQQGSLR